MARVKPMGRRSFRAASRKIQRFKKNFDGTAGQATRVIAEEIRDDVVVARPGKGVPKKDGNLMSSIKPVGPRPDDSSLVTAGGSAAPYALVQHERTDYHHKLGEARYLVRGLERWDEKDSQATAVIKANAEFAIQKARAGL